MAVHVRDDTGGMADLTMFDPYSVDFADSSLAPERQAEIETSLVNVAGGSGPAYFYYDRKALKREVGRLSEKWLAMACLLELPQLGFSVKVSLPSKGQRAPGDP